MKKIISFILILVFLSAFQNLVLSNSLGMPEDVNGDGFVDLTDLIIVFNDAVLFAGPGPTDVNGDGTVTLEDVLQVYNVMILF